MASNYSPSGQFRRYSREELVLLKSSPSCLIPPPGIPDCVPLQKRSGVEEGTERRKYLQIPDRGGYKQSTDHKPHTLPTRPRQPHGRKAGEGASLETAVDAREWTRKGDCREEQTAPIRQRKRTFNADYYLGLEDDTELTIKLYTNIEEFDIYLKSNLISGSGVEKLVKILHKVLTCELQRESVLKILQVVCSSRFLDQHLQTFIEHLQKFSRVFGQKEITDVMHTLLDLLSIICHRLPSERSKVYLIMNYIKGQSNLETVLLNSSVVAEQFEEVLEQSQKLLTTQRKVTGARNKRIEDKDDEIPSEDFVDLPVFPDKEDLDYSKMPFLRPSKTVGAFKDAHHYLDVHFRLLREDFLRPLRNGIRAVKDTDRNNIRLNNMDVRLYQNVRIIGIVPGKTLDYVIQFDVSPFKKVRWQSSKRLIFGSLVCLSDDHFDTVFFAVITKREDEKIEKGVIHVCFETQTGEVLGLSRSRLFTMVESVSFFEANRHVLEGLKQMKDMVPMSRYIVECQQKVNPPSYLKTPGEQVTMNLTALTGTTRYANVENVPVIDFDAWPEVDWKLNQSQLKAVKMALTNELAIIQGPPGTGKTYVGLKIVQVLLDNARVWNSTSRPILIVCYTNHALDQFLEGMLKFCPDDIVRVGSRSQSKALSPFNISGVKKRLKESRDRTARHISTMLYQCHESMKEIAAAITNTKTRLDENFSRIFKAEDLKSNIPPQQYKSLTSKSTTIGRSLMSVWLCGGMIVKNENDFPETDQYDQLARKVTSLILGGEVDFDQDVTPANICEEDFPVRAQMYRFWVKKTKQRLLAEVQECKKADISPKALEEWLEAAEVEILPDYILEPDVDKSLYEAITCREGFPRDIYAPYFIRLWLGIDENDRNHDDLEIVLNELLEAQQGDTSDYCQVNETSYGWQATDSLPDDINWQPPLSTVHTGKNGTPERETEIREIKDGAKKLNIDEEAEILQKQRLLDDDEDDEVVPQMFGEKKSEEDISEPDDTKDSDWKVVNRQKGKNSRKILHLIKTLTPMSEEEAAMITDVWDVSLDVTARVRLYLSWLQKYRINLTSRITNLADSYTAGSRMLSELNMERDGLILKRAKVIGMTTTAAAKYRRLLATVGCPIVIMEEAAEVLEAHVVTTLSTSCQHLILIGDHQQLRPSPTVYELCHDYHLDLSLFERLVNNGLPHSTLAMQHRMRPEVSRLVRHVYPHLQDHPKTRDRPHVRGMKHDVFFFHHEVEEDSDADGKSKSNDHEAELCVALCRYLVQQGYSTESITILVAYTGQIFAIKKIITKDQKFYSGVRVTSIDNYQGEENDIIILSLVRSNKEGKVGFLKTDNRVSVALSRAKIGLYAFGNFRILSANSELWEKIIRTAKEHEQIGPSLAICCENHPDREILVSTAEDFKKSPEGGCLVPCAAPLECGHTCRLLCHGYDTDHEEYRCKESCPEILCELGHKCPKKCHEPCPPCKIMVSKTIPECAHTISIACSKTPEWTNCTVKLQETLSCGHTISVACFETPDRANCQENCQEIRSCGHKCSGKCGTCHKKAKHECSVQVERSGPCGHKNITRCDVDPKENSCPRKCEATLKCGHACPGSCGECFEGRAHQQCIQKCLKPLHGCDHRCEGRCGDPCLPCQKLCPVVCAHGEYRQRCEEPYKPCTDRCPFRCPHRNCRARCSEPCEPCNKNCMKRLRCGHKCAGKCKETCFCSVCEQKYFVRWPPGGKKDETPGYTQSSMRLPRCGHIFTTAALDEYVKEKIKAIPYETGLPCPECKVPIYAWDTWRYREHLISHQENLREIKQLLKREISHSCENISKSDDMLIRNLKDLKDQGICFYSLMKGQQTFDVDKTGAFIRQIKLLLLTQEVTDHLDIFRLKHKTFSTNESRTHLQRDIEALQASLLHLGASMTRQKHQELEHQATRLTYMSNLLCAKHMLSKNKADDPLLPVVQKALSNLIHNPRQPNVIPKVKKVIASCQSNTWWTEEQLTIQGILDVLDMDVCKAVNSLNSSPKGSFKLLSTD